MSQEILAVRSFSSRQFFRPVDTRSIAVISLRLESLPATGSPAAVLYTYLQAFFPAVDGAREVLYYDVPFDLLYRGNGIDHIEIHAQRMLDIIHVLEQYVYVG